MALCSYNDFRGLRKGAVGEAKKRKLAVTSDDTWTLQPELDCVPWHSDFDEELQFPIQVSRACWALLESPATKKIKLDLSNGTTQSFESKVDEELIKRQLLVENIPPEATMHHLQEHLSPFGQIDSLNVLETASPNMTTQLNSVTATVFLPNFCRIYPLIDFKWKEELDQDVTVYLITRSSRNWLRLTNLHPLTKMKTLKKRLTDIVQVTETVKHSQVSRSAILVFKEITPVIDVLKVQHEFKKLLGNRLIFTATQRSLQIKEVSENPISVHSLNLPNKYSFMKWHTDTGTFYHTKTKRKDCDNISNDDLVQPQDGEDSNDRVQPDNGKGSNDQVQPENGEGGNDRVESEDGEGGNEHVMQWEYGEELASNTICVVGLLGDVKRKRLKKLFASAECGDVLEVVLHLDRSPVHAYVTFEDKEGLVKALKHQCQFGEEDAPRIIHFAASKTVSHEYLTELLFQANNSSQYMDTDEDIFDDDTTFFKACNDSSKFCNSDVFKSSLYTNIRGGSSTKTYQTELPPNTVLAVGGLGNCSTTDAKKAFKSCGKVIWLEMLKVAWPVHAYVTYAVPEGPLKAVENQPQVNDSRLTVTVATKKKYSCQQIVELSKQHPKLYLDAAAPIKPIFYRVEKSVPSWALHYYGK